MPSKLVLLLIGNRRGAGRREENSWSKTLRLRRVSNVRQTIDVQGLKDVAVAPPLLIASSEVLGIFKPLEPISKNNERNWILMTCTTPVTFHEN
jgi:hypothetical protein